MEWLKKLDSIFHHLLERAQNFSSEHLMRRRCWWWHNQNYRICGYQTDSLSLFHSELEAKLLYAKQKHPRASQFLEHSVCVRNLHKCGNCVSHSVCICACGFCWRKIEYHGELSMAYMENRIRQFAVLCHHVFEWKSFAFCLFRS